MRTGSAIRGYGPTNLSSIPLDATVIARAPATRRLRGARVLASCCAALVVIAIAGCAPRTQAPVGGTSALRASASQGDDDYAMVDPSVDGIGKTWQGREIASVMGWQAASWLERDAREREERGTLLLRELALQPGMQVADVGAGSGYFSRRMAPLVAPGGTVFAVDVQPEMVTMLRAIAAQPGFGNLQPVLGSPTDPNLAPSSVDVAVMVDVYHELEFPREMLAHLVTALKPGGRLVFVEYRAEDPGVQIKALHKMSEAQVRREAALAGLAWQRTSEVLPQQHIVVFIKAKP